MDLITPSNITFVLGLLAILFSVYRYFREPDENADKRIALLAQQISDSQTGTDRRFKDVSEDFTKLWTAVTEHITNDAHKFESMNATQISMGKELVKIATILEERLPLNRNGASKHKHG